MIDGEETDATNSVSTKVVEQFNQGPIYWFNDPDPIHQSAYGWGADGNGAAYSANAVNQNYIDFYVDGDFDLASPSMCPWSNPHETGMKLITSSSYDDLNIADGTGYYNYANIVDGGTYLFWIQDAYYVKLHITGYDAVNYSISFKYSFQTIPNFRVIGD